MRTIILAVVLGVPGVIWSADAAGPTAADRLAAESLRASAMALRVRPNAPGWAGRMIALANFSQQLVGDDSQTSWLLAQIYETQGEYGRAAAQIDRYLRVRPADFAMGSRWIFLSLDSMDRAEPRIAFLQAALRREDLPAATRAIAAMQSAQILRGQGKHAQALDALMEALKLDPNLPDALNGWLTMKKTPSAADRADAMCRMLAGTTGNPRAIEIAGSLAALLDSLGLQTHSLAFYEYAWELDKRLSPTDRMSYPFVLQYFSAMLDAATDEPPIAERAIERFEPMLRHFPQSTDLRSLLIEAYRLAGQSGKADEMTNIMQRAYEAKRVTSSISAAGASEMAWFYLVTRPRPMDALMYARQAAKLEGDNPIVQRILGAAELRAEQTDDGLRRLGALLDKDAYAAAFLAEHYFAAEDPAQGCKMLLAGFKQGRSGPAFRKLKALAKIHGVSVPPVEASRPVAKMVEAFAPRYLEMGTHPARFLSVEIRPVARTVPPSEPVEVELILTNTGSIPVPLGDLGLLSPVASLQVTVAGPNGGSFGALPLATWPAGRYLPAGKSVACRVRLDVGPLGRLLASRPLEAFQLTVSATLDPVQQGKTIRSRLPGVPIQPAEISRTDILAAFDRTQPDNWPPAYQRTLGLIVRDIKQGLPPQRMRAARQVASLLAMARDVERGKTNPPDQLARDFAKPVLLTMLREVMRDPSPVVRAEMLTALEGVPLDGSIIQLLAPSIDDRSALVRFRLVELLGASDKAAHRTIIDYLSQDPDPHVCRMARSFHK